MRSPRLTRAGTHIAALVAGGEEQYQLMVIDLAAGTREVVGGRGDKSVLSFHWLTDDRILFRLSLDHRFDLGWLVARLDRLSKPYPIYQYGFASLIGIPDDDPLHPVFWVKQGGRQRAQGLFVLDAKLDLGPLTDLKKFRTTGGIVGVERSNERHVERMLPEPTGGEDVAYGADLHGNLSRALVQNDGAWQFHFWQDDAWHISPVDLDTVTLLGAGNRPEEVIAQAVATGGKPSPVRFLNVRSGEWSDVVLEDPDYDFTGWFYRDRKSSKIVGVQMDRTRPEAMWFDAGYASLQKLLDAQFPGRVARIVDGDDSGSKFVVSAYADSHPPTYYLLDMSKRSLDLIAASRPWIDPERMQRTTMMKFATAEGKKLDAYVTLPAGASRDHPVPLVVMPHGGPWVRDTWGFNRNVQYLANLGYAVLQPNYRGSLGYNWMFPREDQWDFLKMHDDVTRATRTLLQSGYIDPQRVAIAGSSFGGYLALSGVVHEPDLYRCAVTFAGVFDWAELIEWTKGERYVDHRYDVLLRRLGNPGDDPEKFERISPGRHVDRIKVPVLVAHGKEDRVVTVGESKRLIRSLKTHGVIHETVIIRGEGHGTSLVENSAELYGRIGDFLGKHLR
ncbi:prolyl oligopeptidase family serine peptidase [Synoicihabitans lomoniglobus]|uniref:Prolyl oligopeptidase family serine peptidase n=2 Tax=Synoicihabitans lomoniglobus TaxID=2909285 RepID=A0AAE9ZX03_9BACT|nr:prolyl oligopeptidase family serine peptidase [Opitutaceae bacterium LMO-M01]